MCNMRTSNEMVEAVEDDETDILYSILILNQMHYDDYDIFHLSPNPSDCWVSFRVKCFTVWYDNERLGNKIPVKI